MSETDNTGLWRTIFADGHPKLKSQQAFHTRLPTGPRCKMCFAPFAGVGGLVMRWRGKGPSNRNPRYCSACDAFLRRFPGGAEVEMSLVFADVRGSVPMAATMQPAEVSRLLAGFYASVTKALIETDGFVLDVRGDCVVGVYPPGFSGPDHAAKAVRAAERLLGELAPRAPDGTPIPVGVGVHTGLVYIGTLSGADGGIQDLTVLGDNANITARLSSEAKAGEAMISAACLSAARLPVQAETRSVTLKGWEAPIPVAVLRAAWKPQAGAA